MSESSAPTSFNVEKALTVNFLSVAYDCFVCLISYIREKSCVKLEHCAVVMYFGGQSEISSHHLG